MAPQTIREVASAVFGAVGFQNLHGHAFVCEWPIGAVADGERPDTSFPQARSGLPGRGGQGACVGYKESE